MIAAVCYFRVFQPGPSYSSIPIDSAETAADPFELVLANRNLLNLNSTLDGPAKVEPKISEPTTRITPPLAPRVEPKNEDKFIKPILPKKVDLPSEPAPPKRVVVKVPIKKEVVKPRRRTYTVKSGDSLWRIARDQLGDASRHLELVELNKATLGGNPNSLKLGQKIILPPK
jgi:nucleoid-associated protein YgaU